MVVVLILLGYLIVGFSEVAYLLIKQQKKEAIIYSIFMTGALVLSLLLAFGVKIPSPIEPIKNALSIFGKLME